MERLTRRLHDADSALARLGEVLAIETPTEVERDAAIKRFDFTFEALWRAAQLYLADREFIQSDSPGAVIRACREAGIGDEDAAEARLLAAKDRNLTSHMYNARTQGIESFWSMLKRGYHGTYHHMSPNHMGRYVSKFSGRHNDRDISTADQMANVARGMIGKRLRYSDLVS